MATRKTLSEPPGRSIARLFALCYSGVVMTRNADRLARQPTLTRQRELLILCARIGFNP